MARYAIVIGIASNLSPLTSFINYAKYASVAADVLEEYGDFDKALRLIGEVSKNTLEQSLASCLEGLGNDDEALIYYIGQTVSLPGSWLTDTSYVF